MASKNEKGPGSKRVKEKKELMKERKEEVGGEKETRRNRKQDVIIYIIT